MEVTNREAVLLLNLGTPQSPAVKDVRRYLRQFLSDGRVIDIPWLGRMLLVHCIIAPFRAPKSARLYRRLWTDKGSPLLFHTQALRDELQRSSTRDVYMAMRYGQPAIEPILDEIIAKGYQSLVLMSLFPQYASSTTGSALEAVMSHLKKQNIVLPTRVVGQFFQHRLFVDVFASNIKHWYSLGYDHVLFSYHGLPKRHVNRTHAGKTCDEMHCTTHYGDDNRYCYHAAAYETTRLLVKAAGLPDDRCTTAFQSRLGNGWLEPFADEMVQSLAQRGVKKLLVVSPSFVADCLETTIEIGHEYRELFCENGGEMLTLVPSLNSTPEWVRALDGIIGH